MASTSTSAAHPFEHEAARKLAELETAQKLSELKMTQKVAELEAAHKTAELKANKKIAKLEATLKEVTEKLAEVDTAYLHMARKVIELEGRLQETQQRDGRAEGAGAAMVPRGEWGVLGGTVLDDSLLQCDEVNPHYSGNFDEYPAPAAPSSSSDED